MASLKQIAEELGVSFSLVSKVLNGRLGTTGVSERTRDAILKKAEELDYKPNRLAVALKSGRQGAVGVFLHGLGTAGSEINERLLRGLAQGLEGSGCQMWLRFFTADEEFLAACDGKLREVVDGLIVAGVRHPDLISKLREINEEGLPVVSIFSDLSAEPRTLIDNVGVDWDEQGFLATRHLLDQGCRRVATFHSEGARHEGYQRAHLEYGIEVDPRLVVAAGGFTTEDGTICLRELQNRKIPFDSIMCESDAQAVGAINELVRAGIKVPDTVKVVGIDNSPLASACIVPVTSVSPEMTQSGIDAVKLLLRKIEGKAVASKSLRPRIVVRASSAVA